MSDNMPTEEAACDHSICTPTFDEEAANGLSKYEIRRRWPRFCGKCAKCGERVIAYASWAHYVMGDW